MRLSVPSDTDGKGPLVPVPAGVVWQVALSELARVLEVLVCVAVLQQAKESDVSMYVSLTAHTSFRIPRERKGRVCGQRAKLWRIDGADTGESRSTPTTRGPIPLGGEKDRSDWTARECRWRIPEQAGGSEPVCSLPRSVAGQVWTCKRGLGK